MKKRLVLVTLGALLFACGPISVEGELDGLPLDASDAAASRQTLTLPVLGTTTDVVTVVIGGGSKDLCRDLTKGVMRGATSYLTLTFGQKRAALAPGPFTVTDATSGADHFASAAVARTDTACGEILPRKATGGVITLDSLEGDRIKGSFDLAFDGDQVRGSFDAPRCAVTSMEKQTCG